jgi:hypothetical protein
VGEVTLTIEGTPPSFNAVGHTGNRWKWTKEKKRWQESIELALMVWLPRELYTFIEARAILTFPTKRRRDEGNYRVLLEKCLGDALVNGGWLADDTPDQFRFHGVEFEHGEARTQIILS